MIVRVRSQQLQLAFYFNYGHSLPKRLCRLRRKAFRPDKAEAYYERAESYFFYSRPPRKDLALADHTNVIRVEPANTSAYLMRGMIYEEGIRQGSGRL